MLERLPRLAPSLRANAPRDEQNRTPIPTHRKLSVLILEIGVAVKKSCDNLEIHTLSKISVVSSYVREECGFAILVIWRL